MIPRWWRWAALVIVVTAIGTFVLDRVATATVESNTGHQRPASAGAGASVGVVRAFICPLPLRRSTRPLATPPWVSRAPWAPSILGTPPAEPGCDPDDPCPLTHEPGTPRLQQGFTLRCPGPDISEGVTASLVPR